MPADFIFAEAVFERELGYADAPGFMVFEIVIFSR